jgi:hypothetical protein
MIGEIFLTIKNLTALFGRTNCDNCDLSLGWLEFGKLLQNQCPIAPMKTGEVS